MTLREGGGDNKKKKSFIPKLFSSREKKKYNRNPYDNSSSAPYERCQTFPPDSSVANKCYSAIQSASRFRNLSFSDFPSPMTNILDTDSYRVFVATWNVGGKTPHSGMNLDEFLQVEYQADIYVLGFQEIVPLNAGNVLVIEDNEPAAKWLTLINQSLNTPGVNDVNNPSTSSDYNFSFSQSSKPKASTPRDSKNKLFFQKPSLKTFSKNFRTVKRRWLKTCNCTPDSERKYSKESCFKCQQPEVSQETSSSEEEDNSNSFTVTDITAVSSNNHLKYSLIVCKQMVGIFLTVWVRKELVQYIGHMRASCIGRGIMGYLGNKGCISVSMSLHQTTLCFVCSHLASGEKEGDELRRNLDVIEILRNTQFRKICKAPNSKMPERIVDHDRVIWLGDLNYRIALSYSETRKLLQENDWDTLFEKDQLKIEREAGRVFREWKEGKIYFAPTYKYSNNSDVYAGETITSKKKRRTPAWCDRILWHGTGIEQLSYIRGESRFSDHRPVCSVFLMEVGILDGRSKKESPNSNSNMRVEVEELLPPSSRFLSNR